MLPALEKYPYIDEVIISHGKKETVFDYESEHCRMVHRRDYIGTNRKYGLARRFLACKDACNDVILSLDDDVIMPESSFLALCDEFARDPDVIHSLFGRNPDKYLFYWHDMHYGEVTYALAGGALMPKWLTGHFFEQAWLASGLVKGKPWPFWGVDDLFMSLVAIKVNKRLNRAYPFQRVELQVKGSGAPVTVSENPAHIPDRTLFSKLAIPALGVADLVKMSPPRARSYFLLLTRGRFSTKSMRLL